MDGAELLLEVKDKNALNLSYCHSAVCLYIERQIHGLPRYVSGKDSAYNAGDPGSISGSGRSPGEGNGYPLQYSCLENPMDRRA